MVRLLLPTLDELGDLLRGGQSFRGLPIVAGALPPHVVLDQSRTLGRQSPAKYCWAVPYLIATPEAIVGTIGGKGLLDGEDEVEMGYNVATAHRRRGYATEAIRQFTSLAAQQSLRLIAHVEPGNVASKRALRRAGYVLHAEVNLPDRIRLERWGLPDQDDPTLEGLRTPLGVDEA